MLILTHHVRNLMRTACIGHDVRIDCFCVLSAGEQGIHLGSWTHIACGCYLFGGSGSIVLEDFCNLSSRVLLYTANDESAGI